MLLNLEDFENSEIRKVVYNINQLHDKEKIKKLKTVTAGLKKFIEDKNSEECKEATFIISVLIEEFPDIMSDEIKDQLNTLIKSENTETRMNAIILYGKYFLEKIESEDSELDSISGDEIDEFIELLNDEVLEIKGNVVFFIEQFPEEYYDYILPRLNLFMDLLGKTGDLEVVDAIFYILGKVWLKTLPIKLSVFNNLKNIYAATSDKDKLLKIISFMREGSYELDGLLKSNEKIKKDEIITRLNDRGPLIKIYDIEMVAKTSNMSYKDVLSNFEKINTSTAITTPISTRCGTLSIRKTFCLTLLLSMTMAASIAKKPSRTANIQVLTNSACKANCGLLSSTGRLNWAVARWCLPVLSYSAAKKIP